MQKRIKAAMGDLRLRGTQADLWAKIRSFLRHMKHQVSPVWVVHLCFKELVCLWKFVLGLRGVTRNERKEPEKESWYFSSPLCAAISWFSSWRCIIILYIPLFFQLLFRAKVVVETSISCFKLMPCKGLMAFPHTCANNNVKSFRDTK